MEVLDGTQGKALSEPWVDYGSGRTTGNAIVDKSFGFALKVVRFSRSLREEGWMDVSRQVLRSSTSISANVHEAQHAESRADFIHKMKLAAKEASEMRFWLKLCKHSEELPFDEEALLELDEIQALLGSIISKAKANGSK